MRLCERIHLIGSGLLGMNSSDAYDCNVYLLDGGSELALIDCGTGYGVSEMLAEAVRDGFDAARISTILLTHAHMDHAGGAHAWKKSAHSSRLAASFAAARMVEEGDEHANGLSEARSAGIYPDDCVFTPCEVDVKLRHGDVLSIGDLTLEVIATPGHSADSLSYYCSGLRALFPGDTVFGGGQIAALQTLDFSMEDLEASIRLLSSYHVDKLLPGHLHPILRDGGRSIEQAAELFRQGRIPRSIV